MFEPKGFESFDYRMGTLTDRLNAAHKIACAENEAVSKIRDDSLYYDINKGTLLVNRFDNNNNYIIASEFKGKAKLAIPEEITLCGGLPLASTICAVAAVEIGSMRREAAECGAGDCKAAVLEAGAPVTQEIDWMGESKPVDKHALKIVETPYGKCPALRISYANCKTIAKSFYGHVLAENEYYMVRDYIMPIFDMIYVLNSFASAISEQVDASMRLKYEIEWFNSREPSNTEAAQTRVLYGNDIQ